MGWVQAYTDCAVRDIDCADAGVATCGYDGAIKVWADRKLLYVLKNGNEASCVQFLSSRASVDLPTASAADVEVEIEIDSPCAETNASPAEQKGASGEKTDKEKEEPAAAGEKGQQETE